MNIGDKAPEILGINEKGEENPPEQLCRQKNRTLFLP